MSEHYFAEAKRASFEARASSQEVRDLNSAAEIAISDRLEEIRQDFSFSAEASDREAWAAAYAQEAEQLLGQGYQLSQAKLIMDMRDERDKRAEKEWVLFNGITAPYRENGMDVNEADEAFEDKLHKSSFLSSIVSMSGENHWDQWDQEDAALKRVVREEYIFTPEEYTLVQAERGENSAERDDTVINWPVAKILETLALDDAREEYARLSAARGARTFGFGRKYSQEDVASAREHYEKCKENLGAYGPASALEALKLANEVAYARKVASGKWLGDDFHNQTTGKHYRKVATLDESRPIARLKKMLRWGEKIDEHKPFWSGENGQKTRYRAAVMAAGPASIGVGILLPPVGIGIIAGGSAWLASRAAKNILDVKPGYKLGRTVKWVVGREQAHRNAIWDAAWSVRQRRDVKRKRFDDAEIVNEIKQALKHVDHANNPISNLDVVIADMIDNETEARLPINRQKLKAQLGTAAVAATTASAIAVF